MTRKVQRNRKINTKNIVLNDEPETIAWSSNLGIAMETHFLRHFDPASAPSSASYVCLVHNTFLSVFYSFIVSFVSPLFLFHFIDFHLSFFQRSRLVLTSKPHSISRQEKMFLWSSLVLHGFRILFFVISYTSYLGTIPTLFLLDLEFCIFILFFQWIFPVNLVSFLLLF